MAKLDAASRNALPTSDFALPEERKFPVNDRSHGVNALARAANKPEDIKAKVRAKVFSKFPDLKKHVEDH